KIGSAVAIEVSQRHGAGIGADRVAAGRQEAVVAVSQQDTQCACTGSIGHCEVEVPVAIEVTHCHRVGIGADRVSGSSEKTKKSAFFQSLNEWEIRLPPGTARRFLSKKH